MDAGTFEGLEIIVVVLDGDLHICRAALWTVDRIPEAERITRRNGEKRTILLRQHASLTVEHGDLDVWRNNGVVFVRIGDLHSVIDQRIAAAQRFYRVAAVDHLNILDLFSRCCRCRICRSLLLFRSLGRILSSLLLFLGHFHSQIGVVRLRRNEHRLHASVRRSQRQLAVCVGKRAAGIHRSIGARIHNGIIAGGFPGVGVWFILWRLVASCPVNRPILVIAGDPVQLDEIVFDKTSEVIVAALHLGDPAAFQVQGFCRRIF